MKRNIGRFQAVPYQMGGEVEEPVMPPQAPSGSPVPKPKNPQIMGAPMPNPGMKKGIMGQISAPRERLTPQTYAGEMAAQKRMKQAPAQSPLGPITGGLKSMGQRPQPQQPAANQPSMGDRWMGEVWQQLTPEQNPGMMRESARGVGYANGGSVQEGMDLYNQTIMELESGGVAGYANGGMVEQSREIASMGRNGDSMLMHVNPAEMQGLQSLLGPVSVNPDTGNPEAWGWLIPLIGLLGGTVAGGAASGWDGKHMALGALTGFALGAGAGALAAPAAAGTVAGTTAAGASGAAGATSATPALTAALSNIAAGTTSGVSPFITGGLGAMGVGPGALAPGAGVLASGAGGGLTAGQVAAAGFGPSAGGIYAAPTGGIGSVLKSPGAKMATKGLGMSQPPKQQQQRMAAAPAPAPRRPFKRPPIPGEGSMDEFLKKQQKGLPGSGLISGGSRYV